MVTQGKSILYPAECPKKNPAALFDITVTGPATQNSHPQKASGTENQAFYKGKTRSFQADYIYLPNLGTI